jgi:hypothetical protein
MFRGSLRYLSVFIVLLAAAVGSFVVRRRSLTEPSGWSPPQRIELEGKEQASPQAAASWGHVFFVDVEGWYQITRYERAVVSPYDLRMDSLPDSLPMRLGSWQGQDCPLPSSFIEWFHEPEIAFKRAYTNAAGEMIWLEFYGSRGAKSYHLFEHTPSTCYPLSGWPMLQEDMDTIPVGRSHIYAQRGIAQQKGGAEKLVVLYWYMWESHKRDPEDGLISIRFTAPVTDTVEGTLEMMKRDFISQLFTEVITWRRF